MKRRKLKTVCAMMLAVTVTMGCGGTKASMSDTENSDVMEENTADTAENTETVQAESAEDELSGKKVGVCVYQFSDKFMTLFRGELESYLISQGFRKDNIMIVDGADSSTVQSGQIDSFIAEGVDLLIINPVDIASAGVITDKAVEAGIPLVYINRQPDIAEQRRWAENGWDVTYVGGDVRQAGTYQGEMVAELGEKVLDRNGNGKIDYVMVEGELENMDSECRAKYSVKALEDAGFEVECLASGVGNWEQEKARVIVEDALEQYGTDVEVVFCGNDAMALGALQAARAAGRTAGEDIYVVGVDALSEALEDVITGDLVGTVFNDYFSQSHGAADAAINYLTGVGNEHYIECDYVKVTKENVEDILDMVN